MTNSNPSVGSISDATRDDPPSLAFDFAWALRKLSRNDRESERRQAAAKALAEYEQAADEPDALEKFFEGTGREALESYCTPYLSFDENAEGQFGFWPDISTLEEDVRCPRSGVVKVNAGDAWPPLWPPHGADIQYVMEVTDHGNVTLYSRARREIWSCV
jgi:hypothetical protein